uniref:RRM domain-containing protein n=1 Tax=Haptolina ericina TaxID=156174 RepID=A0A7S3BEE2_9EUKA|mmetsp:Transcript_56372/g.125825  ORF Transcript_56372/g.125825 Transcript_56372/m.125825 type:complete len:409 (+) Transcript_56372:35-1261(+)
MGGAGGKKKQTKRPTKVVAVRASSKEPAVATAPAPVSAKRSRSEDIIPVTSRAETDYSDNEEASAAAAMALDERTTASMKRQLRSLKPTPEDAGVLYLGHIPHGFYEDQMRGFFSQFGTVSRLRLARNKKTGRSKHYAYIEFRHREVAQIVAKSMNGYLMFSKVLVCKLLSKEEVHPETFKNAHRRFKIIDRATMVRKNFNQPATESEAAKRETKLIAGDRRKRRKLEALGIEYGFGGFAASAASSAKRTRGVLPATASREESAVDGAAPDALPHESGQAAGVAQQTAGKAAKAGKVGKLVAGEAAVAKVDDMEAAEAGAVKAGKLGKAGKRAAGVGEGAADVETKPTKRLKASEDGISKGVSKGDSKGGGKVSSKGSPVAEGAKLPTKSPPKVAMAAGQKARKAKAK